jgi:hypothetical protein
MLDDETQARHPAFCLVQDTPPCANLQAQAAPPYASDLPIRNQQPKIRNRNGGIAQLVERQLCKLEVRGSNPLASKMKLMVES